MYNDLFSIGPVTIHGYGLMIAIGILAALIMADSRAKKKGLSSDMVFGLLFSTVIFGYLCAKLTFLFVEFDQFLADPWMVISGSGFVVIGGLTGGVIAAYVYCRFHQTDFLDYFDLCVPSVAVAQGFGRIGCFLAGCCYGKETDSIVGISFAHSHYAPNNVPLVPTQLFSSAGDFINMAILLFLSRKVHKKGIVGSVYIILYSIGRFIIEFFRADDRGEVGVLSTSQFFSIVTVVAGIVLLILALKKKPVNIENVDIIKAEPKDAKVIHRMKKNAFMVLYERYQDKETSPATESLSKTEKLLSDEEADYWLIRYKEKPIGAIRVQIKENEQYRISPIFVVPAYWHTGVATKALNEVMVNYKQAMRWTVDTIQEEKNLCSFYEKNGFTATEKCKEIKPKMTLVTYEKVK